MRIVRILGFQGLAALLLALAGAALLAVPLLSAQSRALLSGRVVDSSGGALPGADVFVRDLATGLETFARADAEGAFSFALRPGRYRVAAARAEFATAFVTVELPATGAGETLLRLAPAVLTQAVVVSGSREQELIENAVAKVDSISRAQLRDTGYERVSDILAEEPGIVVRSGASGNRSETQIQGIDSRQSLILLDGYPLVGARGIKRGILNMDRQSTNRLDRVEIVKGASSALYGSDAIGGVINMITREPRRRFDGNLTTAAGNLGTFDARGDAGFLAGRWAGFLNVERHKRNPYDLTPATVDSTAAGFRRYDYLAKLNRDFSENFKLSMLSNAFDNRERGNFIGELGPTATTTNDSAQNHGITLNAGLTPLTQLQARAYYGKYDESSTIDLLRGGGAETANLNERLYRLDAVLSRVVGSRQLLQGGYEWTQNEYRGFNRVAGGNDGRQIRMGDAWFHDRIQAHPRLSLTLGGRLNNHSLYGTNLAPRAGLLFRAAGNLRIRANWGQGFRAPDLGQLYFRFLNPTNFYQVIGNPHLAPETSTTVQAGFDYRLKRFRFGGAYFRNDIKNLIQADFIGRPSTPEALRGLMRAFDIDAGFNPGLNRLFYLYRNIDNVYTTGVEAKVELNLTRNLIVSSGYTWLDARDKETSAFLSQRHRHNGNFRVWWSTDRWGGLRANFRGTYFSKWPIAGRGGSFIGDGYQIWDCYAAKPIARGTEIYAAVDNLFDSKDANLNAAQPVFFRADPGRTFRVGMRWNFGKE